MYEISQWLLKEGFSSFSPAQVYEVKKGKSEIVLYAPTRKIRIPLSVFHFDCCWMKEFHWADFVWDGRVFPDPEGIIRRIKKRGLKSVSGSIRTLDRNLYYSKREWKRNIS